VLFIKGLAYSGLFDAMFNRVLSAGLQYPYCYGPSTTFFSFVQNRRVAPETQPRRRDNWVHRRTWADEDWGSAAPVAEHGYRHS